VILANGLVRTLDRQVPTQRALAIAGERIAGGVGVHETALASPEVIDLGGRVVVPGLNDARVLAGDDLDALRRALKVAAVHGVTAVHAEDGLPLFVELEATGALTLRVWQLLPQEQLSAVEAIGLRPGFGSSLLRLGHGLPVAASVRRELGPGDIYGSAQPLEHVDPLADLRTAAQQGVSLDDAFAAMTTRPAALTGDERRRGKLLPGYAADLVVLDRDPWEDVDAEVVGTMVAGRWVHNPPPWS
jgi:predicted amidohydrolase YtcJ